MHEVVGFDAFDSPNNDPFGGRDDSPFSNAMLSYLPHAVDAWIDFADQNGIRFDRLFV